MIYRCSRDAVACRLIDGDAFTGQSRFVDRTAAVAYDAVNGDAFAGAHDEYVADPDLLRRDRFLLAVTYHNGGFGRKLCQTLQRVGRFAF